MKRFALGTSPHSERVAETSMNVLGGKVLLRMKSCGEPGGLQGEIIRSRYGWPFTQPHSQTLFPGLQFHMHGVF